MQESSLAFSSGSTQDTFLHLDCFKIIFSDNYFLYNFVLKPLKTFSFIDLNMFYILYSIKMDYMLILIPNSISLQWAGFFFIYFHKIRI